jgi:DNA invertase Pin-like site-specific DNA recombinase
MSGTTGKAQRAALYARVSTTGHGQDVGLQLDELRQVAAQRGWTVVEEFVDEGISGAKASRPALDRMMEAARLGKIDVVAVWKLDRLGRSLANLLTTLDELGHHGVGFVSLRDAGIDTTSPAGRLLLQLMGAFAEFERGLIRERCMAGQERARAKGKHIGRPRSEAQPDALRAASTLIAQGWSLRQVAKATGLNKDTLRRRLAEVDVEAAAPPRPAVPRPPAIPA